MFNLIIHNARSALAAPVLVLALLLVSACGDGGDVVIVALTRTPTPEAAATGPSEPTPPRPPTEITVTATPPPSGAVPNRPNDLLAGGFPVSSYLAGGSADIAGCLPGLVAAWDLAPVLGERCIFADVDGDGASEFAFAVVATTEGANPGDVWFFQGADEQFRLFSSARVLATELLEDVVLEAAADLTGDRFPDLVVSARICSADVCAGRLLIASAHTGTFKDLAPAGIDFTDLHSIRVEDASGDGLQDVVLRYEYTPDLDAGPQRDGETVLTWAGLKFFDTARDDPPRYLFHAILDADAAFEAGDYEAARAQYETARRRHGPRRLACRGRRRVGPPRAGPIRPPARGHRGAARRRTTTGRWRCSARHPAGSPPRCTVRSRRSSRRGSSSISLRPWPARPPRSTCVCRRRDTPRSGTTATLTRSTPSRTSAGSLAPHNDLTRVGIAP